VLPAGGVRPRAEEAGLLIEAIREPADPAGGRWARVPMFLMWRAVKAR
jgi:hypothetical protein